MKTAMRQRCLASLVIAGLVSVSMVGCSPRTPTTTSTTTASTLTITARADLYRGAGADVDVRVNDAEAGTFTVKSTTFKPYQLRIPTPASGASIDVRYTNDASDSKGDRDLYVRSVSVGAWTVDSGSATYDLGLDWPTATDGAMVMPGQDKMEWAGALRFTYAPNGPSNPPTASESVSASSAQWFAHIFSMRSFWYQQIPANVTLNSRSAIYVRQLLSDISSTVAGYNSTEYAPPIYVVDSRVRRVSVRNSLCQGAGSDRAWTASKWKSQLGSVPIPSGAKGSAGQDSEIVIYSPSTNELWEMWHFASSSSGYSACWGGKISKVSSSTGVFAYPFGVTASGLSMLGGTVRISELLAGHIDHAVEIGVNRPRSGVYSWPANRTDGTWNSSDAIPEGLRFRLDPKLNINSLNLNPVAKMIAVAAQKYGFVVRDNTLGPLVVYGENSAPYEQATGKDPYAQVTSAPPTSWMDGFPWSHLQALPFNFGKS